MCYSVELDFKLQEEKLQPLMKRLCPLDSQQCPALPYSNEVFTTTPKRKSKSESKKHARWKLWFLWVHSEGSGSSLCSGSINTHVLYRMKKGMFRRHLQNWWQQNPVHLGFSVETALWVIWSTAETKRKKRRRKKKNNYISVKSLFFPSMFVDDQVAPPKHEVSFGKQMFLPLM